MPKISVIVPIYNSEKYLDKCLNSIKNQTYKDFEVIMIDDGSNDGSKKICRKFMDDDARFLYIFKKNGGSSSARNLGLEKATGEYIAFIDSDDFVESDYLETLTPDKYACDFDVIQCGMTLVRNNNKTDLIPDSGEMTGEEFVYKVLKREFPIFLFQTTVTKLYKRSWIISSGVRFDEGITVSEDSLFNTQLLCYVNSVKFINSSKYRYIQDNSTLTKQKSTFYKAFQSVMLGNITSEIRNKLIIERGYENDPLINKGFSQAICIIYLSNAYLIETGDFNREEKKKLYNSFFLEMNYPITPSINEYTGTDKAIIEACHNKNRNRIHRIYSLRQKKAKTKKLLRLE